MTVVVAHNFASNGLRPAPRPADSFLDWTPAPRRLAGWPSARLCPELTQTRSSIPSHPQSRVRPRLCVQSRRSPLHLAAVPSDHIDTGQAANFERLFKNAL